MAGRHAESPERRPVDAAQVCTLEDLALVLRWLRRREARQREGAELTYRQLARQAGWSHTVVASYLTGRALPPIDRFDSLVQLLGATGAEQRALATARDRVEERRRGQAGRPRTRGEMPVPRQLPADVPDFVGRGDDLTALDGLLPAARRSSTVLTAVVTGAPGVGKSTLAVHWAHRLARRFPHGQLYADLRGFSPETPTPPEQVLDGFLVSLGCPPADVPGDLDGKAALFRSLVSGRRLLVLLDNAADPQQVRPLFPAAAGSLVIVTSRHALTGLAVRDRARRFSLEVPSHADAAALLTRFLGADRAAREHAAAEQIVRLCGHLPAALCVIGARAGGLPDVPLARIVEELMSSEGHRLDALDAGDAGNDLRAALRTIFSWSYWRLPADAARLFQLLGSGGWEVEPGTCGQWRVDPARLAGMAGLDRVEADRLVEVLVSASLLRRDGQGRHLLHELLRCYAAELARQQLGRVNGSPASPVPVTLQPVRGTRDPG